MLLSSSTIQVDRYSLFPPSPEWKLDGRSMEADSLCLPFKTEDMDMFFWWSWNAGTCILSFVTLGELRGALLGVCDWEGDMVGPVWLPEEEEDSRR